MMRFIYKYKKIIVRTVAVVIALVMVLLLLSNVAVRPF
jgi:hypothetical protein